MMRRLFVFAAYDPHGVVGPSLLHQLGELSRFGDIVLRMDNDCPAEELGKTRGTVIHAGAGRHGEYDFGSYKRAFLWAGEHLDLGGYDFCYFVNDSVYGPFGDLGKTLESMEAGGAGAFSLVYNPHRTTPHLQSWFMGFRPEVFMSDWFHDFIAGVTAQPTKEMVCIVYETGLTSLLTSHGIACSHLVSAGGKRIYNDVERLFFAGLPFFKKSAFTRHNGSLGRQVRRILDSVSPEARDAVIRDASRLLGDEYVIRFLSCSRLCAFTRYLGYLVSKLKRLTIR